jgi:hypothetical protein
MRMKMANVPLGLLCKSFHSQPWDSQDSPWATEDCSLLAHGDFCQVAALAVCGGGEDYSRPGESVN